MAFIATVEKSQHTCQENMTGSLQNWSAKSAGGTEAEMLCFKCMEVILLQNCVRNKDYRL